ncbi:methyltransferase domain-containing protein [Botrytis cinerea]
MNTKEYIMDVFQHLWFPVQFMFASATFLPGTIISLLASSNIATLSSVDRFKDAWFARFWGVYGPRVRETASTNAEPMIKAARGIVLDIGPGSGEWLHVFDKSKVTKIYGVEPNRDHYEALRRRIKEAGLTDIYEIAECGVEGLTEWGIQDDSVDSVVTILWGIWAVYEHVIKDQGHWAAKYQSLVNIAWPHFLGGCSLKRDTEKSLREVGKWSKVDLKHPATEAPYAIVPHIMEHWRSDFHALKYTQRGSSCENWNLWPSLSMSEKRDACFLIREIVRIKKDTESLRSLSGEVANFVFRKEELTVYCHFDGCINSFESSFSLFYNTF